ncbi:hypothetical protein CLU79DRAFT_750460 [Phycomyces nitens]|nr:hypothetical protein CLU79DRAFT_750460 [Phycomyces nitens]
MEDIELRYSTNPRRPSVQSGATIYGNPKDDYDKEQGITFETKAQLLGFINSVYQPIDESEPKTADYIQKNMSMKNIFGVIIKYSDDFKSVDSFTTWCSKSKSNLLSVEPVRKVVKIEKYSQKVRLPALNVLEDKYHEQIAKKISSTLAEHATYMKKLKNEGFYIVGYCRKSDLKKEGKKPRNFTTTNGGESLQALSRRLCACVPMLQCQCTFFFEKRFEWQNNMIFSALQSIHGDSKDMLSFISDKKKICIVCLDYAGLTTNILDLKQILQNNENIEKKNHS